MPLKHSFSTNKQIVYTYVEVEGCRQAARSVPSPQFLGVVDQEGGLRLLPLLLAGGNSPHIAMSRYRVGGSYQPGSHMQSLGRPHSSPTRRTVKDNMTWVGY